MDKIHDFAILQQNKKTRKNEVAKPSINGNNGRKSPTSIVSILGSEDRIQKVHSSKNGKFGGKQIQSISRMVATKVTSNHKETVPPLVKESNITTPKTVRNLKSNILFKVRSSHNTRVNKYSKNSVRTPTEIKSEIAIKIKDQLFRIDRKIIFGKSKYLQNILMRTKDISTEDEPIFLEDITVSAFTPIATYFETGELPIGAHNIGPVLEAAIKLEIDEIIELCLQYKDLILETGEYMQAYELATKYNIKDLRKQALELMQQKFSDIKETPSFLQYNINQLCLLLNDDNLKISNEKDVFNAGLQWLIYDFPSRQSVLHRVLSCIRFPLMSTADLVMLAIGDKKQLQVDKEIGASQQDQYRTIIERQEETQRRIFDALVFKGGLRSGLEHRVAHLMPKLRYHLEQPSADNIALTKLNKEITAAITIQAGFKGYNQRQQEQVSTSTPVSQSNSDYLVIL